MRHNYTTRRSNLEEFYDVVYDSFPELPYVFKIIDHSRKLTTINTDAPINGEVREVGRK